MAVTTPSSIKRRRGRAPAQLLVSALLAAGAVAFLPPSIPQLQRYHPPSSSSASVVRPPPQVCMCAGFGIDDGASHAAPMHDFSGSHDSTRNFDRWTPCIISFLRTQGPSATRRSHGHGHGRLGLWRGWGMGGSGGNNATAAGGEEEEEDDEMAAVAAAAAAAAMTPEELEMERLAASLLPEIVEDGEEGAGEDAGGGSKPLAVLTERALQQLDDNSSFDGFDGFRGRKVSYSSQPKARSNLVFEIWRSVSAFRLDAHKAGPSIVRRVCGRACAYPKHTGLKQQAADPRGHRHSVQGPAPVQREPAGAGRHQRAGACVNIYRERRLS